VSNEDATYVAALRRRAHLVDAFYGFYTHVTQLEQCLAAPAPR
jgi:hypothetical protein